MKHILKAMTKLGGLKTVRKQRLHIAQYRFHWVTTLQQPDGECTPSTCHHNAEQEKDSHTYHSQVKIFKIILRYSRLNEIMAKAHLVVAHPIIKWSRRSRLFSK